jgi:hypothetical protein
MIPPEWLTEQTTLEEIEKLKVLDVLQLPAGYEVIKKYSGWAEEFAYADRPEFVYFKSCFKDGDEVWKYKAGNLWTDQTGMSGFALKRNGHIITYMPTSYKL